MKAKSSLAQRRGIAVAALLVCLVGMGVCRWLEPTWPGLSWPRAFFEAGTVGAMADWFAVVALFRHPCGIPIPHTAILPKNKGRVAESLAGFIESSFLTEEQLGPRFRRVDYAGLLARWLREHAEVFAKKAGGFAPKILAGVSDAEVSALLAERARSLLRTIEFGPMAGEGLTMVVQNGRDREIFRSLLKSSENLILSHQELIQKKIQEEIPIPVEMIKGIPALNRLEPFLAQIKSELAVLVTRKTIEKVRGTLAEAESDPEHALWKAFDGKLRNFISDLKGSPEMAGKIRSMQQTFAASAVVEDFSAKVWTELKAFLLRDFESEDSVVCGKLRDAVRSAADQLEGNETAKTEINGFLADQILKSLVAAKPHVRELVVSTVTNWDATEMSQRLEATVGADLQFIRLNGTIVGGLIGVFIHAVFTMLGR